MVRRALIGAIIATVATTSLAIALLLTAGVASAQPVVSGPGPAPTPGVLPPSPPATAGNCASWITGAPPQLGDAGAPCGASSVVGANPTASAGLTAVNGVAATFLRSDGAPAIDQTIAPTWTGAHTWTAGGTFNGGLASDGKSFLLVTGTNNGVAAAQYGVGESITCNTAAQLTNCDGYNGSVTWAGAAGYGNNLEGVNVPFMTLSSTFSESDTVASGTYNSGTGAVTLTMSNSDNFVSGQTVYVNITGLTGPYIATGGTVGSTINFTAATGLSPVFTGGIVYTAPHVTYLDSCNGWNDNRTTPPAVSDFYNCTTANGAGFNYTGNPGIYNFNQFYGKDIGGRGSYLPVTGQTVNYNKFIALMSSATTNVAYSPVGFTNSSANITGTNLPPINTVVNFVNSGGALPSPFVAGTTYYVVSNTSNTTMTVSATLSGSPITATSAGTGTQNMISTGIATGTLNQCGFCVPAWNPPTTQGAGAVTQNGFYDQSTNVASPDVFMPGVSIGTTNPPTTQGGLRVSALINANSGIALAGNSSITSGNVFTVANGATLSVAGTLSGAGVSAYLASPPAIGGTSAAAGSFTTLNVANPITYGGVTLSNAVTGTGNMVLSTSPTLVTPNLGTPSAATLTNATGLPVSTGISGLGANVATALATALNGTGAVSATTSATFVTPNLGTPSAATLTNATGLPISTGVSGLGTGVATLLAGTPSGTGGVAGTTSPTFTTPTLGAATATTINGNTFTTGSYTLTGTAAKTLTFTNSITLSGTDAQTYTLPIASDSIPGLARTQTWTAVNTYSSGSIKFSGAGGLFSGNQQVLSGTALTTCALGGAGTCSYTTSDGSLSNKITLASASSSTTTLTMTFPNAVTNMYVCYGYDFTTPAQRFLQTGGSTTTAVMTFYSLAGVAGYASGGASDVLYVACIGN